MRALGITEEVWDAMRIPRFIGHDLDETTTLYIDTHIALDIFHMRYPVYMALTTPMERKQYQLYLALRGEKEKHAQWHAEHDPKTERVAYEAINRDARP